MKIACAIGALSLVTALSSAGGAQAREGLRRRVAAPRVAQEWRALATLRLAGGVALIRAAGLPDQSEWTVDALAGVRFLNATGGRAFWVFGGDVGVSLGPRGGATEVLWLGGPNVSYGGMWISVAWSPRLVWGDLSGRGALGARSTLSGCVVFGVGCVDVAYQILSVGEGIQHDLRITVGLDLGMLAQFIVQFAGARPG